MVIETLSPPGSPDPTGSTHARRKTSMFEPTIVRRAILDSFVKLNPRTEACNPIMFIVEISAVWTTVLFVRDLGSVSRERPSRHPAPNASVDDGLRAPVRRLHHQDPLSRAQSRRSGRGS